MADAESMQDHCIFSCFMGSQVCWHIPGDILLLHSVPKLSRLILTDPSPAKPHKATACPGGCCLLSCPGAVRRVGFIPPLLPFFFSPVLRQGLSC